MTIHNADESDAGNYQIQITENVKDSARLVVHPLPAGFKKALEDMTANERDAKVTFDIVTDNDVKVEWLINDQEVSKSSDKYSIEIEHGRFHCFTIHKVKKSDDCIVTARIPQSGAECSARLFVHALDVAVKKPMVEQEVFEGESAMFDLELSHEDVEGFWYRDGIEIEQHDEKYEMVTKGKKHMLTIRDVNLNDECEVTFKAGSNVEQHAKLYIRDVPIRFVRGLEPQSKTSVGEEFVFECELNLAHVDCEWTHNGRVLMSYPGKITIEEQGKVRRLRIHEANFDHEGTYACDCKEDCLFLP